MYCSTCGSFVPGYRSTCDTCGTAIAERSLPSQGVAGSTEALPSRIGTCPRCDYQGQGLPYFSRGPHVAGIIAATLFTLPWALGGGGVLYYVLRRDHRICPRCGKGWGKLGEVARVESAGVAQTRAEREIAFRGGNEGLQRAWSIILMLLAAVMIVAGTAEFELMVIVLGVLAGAGGFALHRNAGKLREERRTALISQMQQPVLKLAAEQGGLLTVTEVAASLGWPLRRAEKVLHSLDDGWRVSSEVTDEGVIVYEFRELRLRPGNEESA